MNLVPSILKIMLITILISPVIAKYPNPNTLNRQPSTVEYERFEGNNIANWFSNDGQLVSILATGNRACEWPAGTGKSAAYHAGIWVVGQVDGELRSAAAEYVRDWSPGTIPYDRQSQVPLSDTPVNTTLDQIYQIRAGDSSDPSSAHYNREYATWPASQGAPAHDGEYYTDQNGNEVWDNNETYTDFNQNGRYDAPDDVLITGEDPPLFSGDDMAWYVMNDWDTTAHQTNWNTTPLGLEAQVLIKTITDDPIYENVQFHTVKLINKSGGLIDSAFYAAFIDPDIGDAQDDATGCDPTLSLGYAYNNHPHDSVYDLRPPAVGYVLLQGPLVESITDTTWFGDQSYPGHTTLDMTAFVFFSGSWLLHGFPQDVQEGYFRMQGLSNDGDIYYDPWGVTTQFLVSGDPVNHTGWTDIDHHVAGDRYFLTSSGPFDMEPWDDLNNNGQADFGEPGVQIIYSALIIVDGADHLDAITNLRYVTRFTQNAFDKNFQTFTLEPPELSVSAHDQEIILNWYAEAETYETISLGDYEFEGYNLYQGESAAGPWTRLETFDVGNDVGLIIDQSYDDQGYLQEGVVQHGSDSGLEYLTAIREDALQGGMPLINNKLYHYALSAYAYAGSAVPKSIESEKQIVSVRPHVNWDGSVPRDTLSIIRPEWGEVSITIDVRDPEKLTGLDYEIGFDYDSTTALGRWNLLRSSPTQIDTLLQSDWFDQHVNRHRHDDTERYYLDGFELSLVDISFAPPRLNHSWEQTVNLIPDTNWIDSYPALSPGGVDSLLIMDGDTVSLADLFGFPPWNNLPEYGIHEEGDQTWFDIPREALHSVNIQGFSSNFGALGGDMVADIPWIGGGSDNVEFLQADLEIRFTEEGQKASKYLRTNSLVTSDSLLQIPFEVWDLERDIQLCLGIADNNLTGGIQDTSLDNWENTLDRDWVIIFDRDYEIFGDSVDSVLNNPYSGWAWQFHDESKFSIGDVIHLSFLNPVVAGGDVYQWSTNIVGVGYAEDALEQIQVFPNPFFGYHKDQTSTSNPFITFSNLPNAECTLRIYSLAGQLIRRFDHTVGTYETWDLTNTYGSAVASGIYIVHIEVEEVGNKILKLAVFQPER